MFQNNLSMTELSKGYDPATGAVINLMVQTNDIIQDIPMVESNKDDGHETLIVTELPEVHWARMYKGTPPSKGERSMVKDATGRMETLSQIDARFKDLYPAEKLSAFRLDEGKLHIEALTQEFAQTLFYGDETSKFKGLALRYPTADSANVIDAGGTTADGELTSMWLISWGTTSCHGIFPKGSQGGVSRKDYGEQKVNDSNGDSFMALEERFAWNAGVSVRDWRAVVRIANIPVEKASLDYGAVGFVDLRKLLIKAKNKMPAMLRKNAIWYANEDIMTAVEIQSSDPKGVHLRYGELFDSKEIAIVHGRPFRQCDAILSTEAQI